MIKYIVKRLMTLIPLLLVLSFFTFFLIQLPEGDYLSMYIQQLRTSGTAVDDAEVQRLTAMYGVDKPFLEQYFIWIKNIVTKFDFGRSFQWNKPVLEVIADRIVLTTLISLLSTAFVWAVAVPIGIYSAVRQYSLFDYFFTFIGYIGLATPGFVLAIVVVWLAYSQLGLSVTGLFSSEYLAAGWSFGKILDLLKHIWVPVIILGVSGTAGIIRVMRGTLLDELKKQYVTTAKAKGMKNVRLLMKYPVRVAINPMISTIGWMLPSLISGEVIVSIVLNLPTCGPILQRAIMLQDMYLAGGFMVILSSLTVIGTLVSDILLSWADPRIRFSGKGGQI